MKADDSVLRWLLDGDPVIRWQTHRDLLDAGERTVAREQRAMLHAGWTAKLLSVQEPSGQWGGGLYTPKWISTTYTLLLLQSFGLHPRHPQALAACRLLLDGGMYRDGGINFFARWGARSETCVTGMAFSLATYFELNDPRRKTLLEHLLAQQMPDGGWNCQRPRGATHGSFHTTISVLEGLEHCLDSVGVLPALERAREFLLAHRLFRSHRTGAVVKPAMTRFAFPPRWHYDVLRGLDHFRACRAPRDGRLQDAIHIVYERRGDDGRWILQNRYPGRTYFEMEKIGEPSRWNTLRALRVLRWWESRD